jgi:hypothetical protein
MTETHEPASFFDKWRIRLIWFFNWIYFLRFPIITALALVGLPYLGLVSALKSLLASLFVTDKLGISLVSAVAFTTCWAILTTWRLIRLYGTARFKLGEEAAETTEPIFRISLRQMLVAGLLAVPVTASVAYETVAESDHTSATTAILFAALGLAGSLLLFFLAVVLQLFVNSETRARQLYKHLAIVSWLPVWLIDWIARKDPAKNPRRSLRKFLKPIFGEGFFNERENRFLAGHGMAAALFVVTFVVFILAGILAGQLIKVEMPALFFVVLLLMLLCWGLSGLSFMLDRFRFPVMLVLLAITYVSNPNYFYGIETDTPLQPLTPQAVLSARGATPQKVIVVATEGGGIQAAAWTAQVMSGIQNELPGFANAVRVISSVSGGSVGALFFVNSYDPQAGMPAPEALELVTKMAAGNSLDEVARGLVYHDFFNTVLFGFWPFGRDRGIALEDSWSRNCKKVCDEYLADKPYGTPCPVNCEMKGTLAAWATDVAAGKRPASIFNGTVVENGDRLLIANTDVKEPIDRRGRINIAELLDGKDVQADTAARLSATFPYVSPAARSRLNQPPDAMLHVVDGGYYDNYGMTSLVEWLNNAMAENLISETLVIQIQSFPEVTSSKEPDGYVSQLLAPVETLLNIRTSAQASHKAIEFKLLQEKWPNRVRDATFRFCCLRPDDKKKNCYDPPLTWKLTDREKANVTACWSNGSQKGELQKVADFMAAPK